MTWRQVRVLLVEESWGTRDTRQRSRRKVCLSGLNHNRLGSCATSGGSCSASRIAEVLDDRCETNPERVQRLSHSRSISADSCVALRVANSHAFSSSSLPSSVVKQPLALLASLVPRNSQPGADSDCHTRHDELSHEAVTRIDAALLISDGLAKDRKHPRSFPQRRK